MKNLTLATLLAVIVIMAGLYLHQTRKASQAQAKTESLRQNVNDLESSLAEQEQQTTRSREQLEQTRADEANRSLEAAHLRAALKRMTNQDRGTVSQAASEQSSSKASNPLSEMFKNPQLKEMIKNQQKGVLGAMIDKNYGRLFSDLHLAPEQASALKDMILNKQLGAAEMGMSMFTGEQSAAQRAELVQQVKASGEASDAQIKQFLGEDNFAQFQGYEKTIPERMVVSGFKDQLGAGDSSLSDDQEQQLIQAMTQERANFKFTTDFSDKSKLTGDFASMLTEDKMNQYSQELERLNQQYLGRAQTFLSPDQFAAFGKYLNAQQTMQKAGMQMAIKMFSPSKPGGNADEAPPGRP